MRGPSLAVTEPIAVRGGVLMVPLAAERPGRGWPEKLTLTMRGGTRIAGVVAWVHAQPPERDPAWTTDPRSLAVRAIEADDDSSVAGGTPYLLAWLPADGAGWLRLGRQRVQPRWLDPVESTGEALPELAAAGASVRPDPRSPFEYWRWVQLAGRLQTRPPPVERYGPVGGMVARHYSDLWRIGLVRLGKADPEVLHRCLNMLLRICYDGAEPFAAWVMDPGEIGGLLKLLLDDRRDDAQLTREADLWVRQQGLLVMRVAPQSPELVAMSVANRGRVNVTGRFQWLGSGDVAAELTLPPGVLRQVDVLRPPAAGPPGAVDLAPSPSNVRVLMVEAGGHIQRMTFPTGPLAARPPGVGFMLRPPMTLFEAQAGWTPVQEGPRPTYLQLRRRHDRWEVFLECRRTDRLPRAADLRPLRDVWETRGLEAVTLLFGDPSGGVELTVPETGDWRLFRGAGDGTLEVHRQSYADRWYCRVVVPDAWLRSEEGPALLGAMRTHGADNAIETGPFASLPWRPAPGRAVIDLEAWGGQ